MNSVSAPEPVERTPLHPSSAAACATVSKDDFPSEMSSLEMGETNTNSHNTNKPTQHRRSTKSLFMLQLHILLLLAASWSFATADTTEPRRQQQLPRSSRIRHGRNQHPSGNMKMMATTELRVLAQKTSSSRPKRQRGRANQKQRQRAAAQKGTFLNNDHGLGRAARNDGQSIYLESELAARQEQSLLQTPQFTEYPLPAFGMVLRLRQDVHGDDDWDDKDLANALERVTRNHLQQVFDNTESGILEVHDEMFADLKLSVKVRAMSEDMIDSETSGTTMTSKKSGFYLAAAFSGVVSYRFSTDNKTGESLIPEDHLVAMAIDELLRKALVGENYLLLFRKYLSDSLLNRVDDVEDLTIGTESLAVMDMQPKATTAATIEDDGHIHTVTVVAIVLFMVLSCLFMLFGTVVIMLMHDKKKTDLQHNQQAMASAEPNNEQQQNGTLEHQQDAQWKEHVLSVLRQFLVVRRQWRRQMRQWHRQAKKQWKKKGIHSFPFPRRQPSDTESGKSSYPGDEMYAQDIDFDDQDANNQNKKPNNVEGDSIDEDDDDDSVYYDEDVRNDEAWLDEWSKILTSIPLTNVATGTSPTKKKKSQATLAPRPAHRQARHQSLHCIDEEADASSVVSAGSSVSARSARSSSRGMSFDLAKTLEGGSEDESDEEDDILASVRSARIKSERGIRSCYSSDGSTSVDLNGPDSFDDETASDNDSSAVLSPMSMGSDESPTFDRSDRKDSPTSESPTDCLLDRAII